MAWNYLKYTEQNQFDTIIFTDDQLCLKIALEDGNPVKMTKSHAEYFWTTTSRNFNYMRNGCIGYIHISVVVIWLNTF